MDICSYLRTVQGMYSTYVWMHQKQQYLKLLNICLSFNLYTNTTSDIKGLNMSGNNQ